MRQERRSKLKRKMKFKNEDQLKVDLAKAKKAKKRLASAIKKKDFVDLDIAQGFMEVAKVDIDRVTAARTESKH